MKKLTYLSLIIVSMLALSAYAAPVTEELLFHFKADALNLNNGDLVYEWPDVAVMDGSDGTARQRTSPTVWGVPTFVTNAYKGFPAVQFAGPDPTTDATRTVLESSTWDWDINKPITVFMVCTGGRPTLPPNVRALAVGRPGGNLVHTFAAELSSLQSGARFNNGSALSPAGASPFAYGDWHTSIRRVQALTATIDTFYYAVNSTDAITGLVFGQGTNIFTPVDTGNKVLIGGGYANDAQNSGTIYTTELYDGKMAEILVYNYLEQNQIEQVYDWLTNKYDKLMAHNPSPVCSAVDQGTFNTEKTAISVNFGWNTGLNTTGTAPNTQIAGHWFYCVADEPNFLDVQPQWVSNNPVSATASLTINSLLPDKRYYWRVDESVYSGGQPSPADDPNCILGDVWFFDTPETTPIIDTQPTNQLVELNETATFTVSATSVKPITYYWYKSADATIDAGDQDQQVNSNTLSITADFDKQGFYYCKVDNGSTELVYTNVVMLGIKRKVAHWTLDSVNYVGGVYQDVCTEDPNDFPIDPNLPPVTGSIVPNDRYAALGDALNLTVQPMAAGWSKKVWAAAYTDNITVSAWVKWQGAEGITTNQGIVANQADAVDGVGNSNNWFLDIPASNDRARFNVAGTGGGSATGPVLPINEWVHVAGSVGPDGIKFYVNGKTAATNSNIKALINRHKVPFYLGCSQRNATGILEILNGSIDDVQVFNYQLPDTDVAQIYYDIAEVPVCINPSALSMNFDVAGGGLAGDEPDCLVNLKDFAEFAATWMNCGYYPQQDCP